MPSILPRRFWAYSNVMKSMSHTLNFHLVGSLEAIVKFLNLGGLTTSENVRKIVREAKLNVHLRHIVFMNQYFADLVGCIRATCGTMRTWRASAAPHQAFQRVNRCIRIKG